MRLRRPTGLIVAATLALSGLIACSSPAENRQANAASVLNVGMPNGPQTENHNPFLGSSAAASLGYRRLIYEPLAMVNDVKVTEPPKPWLATKWEWSNNFRTLKLTIRDKITWSDGKPLTAEDVAFTFQLLRDNPGLNSDAVPYTDISSSGNEVTLGFPRSQFVNQKKIFEQLIVPEHIWSTVADPTTDTVKNPVGSGPYALKSFTQQAVTLTLRDSYWQELPKVKELRYTSYSDNNTQATALATGAAEWSFVFIPNYEAVYTSKDPDHHKLWFPPVLGIHGLWFNTRNAPFDNPALRKAVSMVINRDDIFMQGEAGYFYPKVDNITGIPTPAGESFIAPEFAGKTINVDVDGAKSLLTGAGFTFNGDKLQDSTGKPVTITMTVPAGWSDYVTDLEIIKDNLSSIGIEATVDTPNVDSWTKALDTGDFQAAMHWSNSGATPYDIYQSIMDGSLLKPIGTGGVNGNYGRYDNPTATKALQDYANATDEAGRTEAMHTLQRIFVDEMPVAITSAANAGGVYSTKNWVGWPDAQNQYAPAQVTWENALDIIMHLRPAAGS
jgi:peptide/nickel transport system substrate-binding protein